MKFKLDLPLFSSNNKINYKDKLMFIGSCFTENIGNILIDYQFNIIQNPSGILFHPIAVFNILYRAIDSRFMVESDLVFDHELWHSLEHHSDFSHYDKNICINNINHSIKIANEFLKDAQYIFITLGTSVVYEWRENNKIVSNCHKIDAKLFNKKMLFIDDINNSFDCLHSKLSVFNPNIKIIFTISPVRHWRDGLIENNRSKAKLIYCVDEWCKKYNNVSYFPAYELVLDDLRDYRFFTDDLCHPNQLAIQYVWEYFINVYFDLITKEYITDYKELINMLSHKVKFEQTNANKILQNKIEEKNKYIINKYLK